MSDPESDPTPSPLDSPLLEAAPNSLEELFNRSPFDLTDAELDRMVLEYRRLREEWIKAEAQGAVKAPRSPKGTSEKVPRAAIKVATSLADLGL